MDYMGKVLVLVKQALRLFIMAKNKHSNMQRLPLLNIIKIWVTFHDINEKLISLLCSIMICKIQYKQILKGSDDWYIALKITWMELKENLTYDLIQNRLCNQSVQGKKTFFG
jgi:hypothetical protein